MWRGGGGRKKPAMLVSVFNELGSVAGENNAVGMLLQRKCVLSSHAEEGFPVKVSFVIRK